MTTIKCQACHEPEPDLNEHGVCESCEIDYAWCDGCGMFSQVCAHCTHCEDCLDTVIMYHGRDMILTCATCVTTRD